MTRRFLAIGMLALVCCLHLEAKSGAGCIQVAFTGEVHEHETFRKVIGNGEAFTLSPASQPPETAPSGWEFALGPEAANDNDPADYIYFFTPPLRGSNAQQVNTGWGVPSQEVIARDRPFQFLLNPREAAKASKLMDEALWPKNESEGARALNALWKLPHSSGNFDILDSKIEPGEYVQGSSCDQKCGSLRWIRFRVSLVLPSEFPVSKELESKTVPCPVPKSSD